MEHPYYTDHFLIPPKNDYRVGVVIDEEAREIRVIRYDVMGTIDPEHSHVFTPDQGIAALECVAAYVDAGAGASDTMLERFAHLFHIAILNEYIEKLNLWIKGETALTEIMRLINGGYTSADCPWNTDPEEHEEYYRFLVYNFDVRRAKQILAETPHKIRLLSIIKNKENLRRPEPDRWEDVPGQPGVRRLVGGFNPMAPAIQWDIIDSGKIDLTIPVISAAILDPQTGEMLIEWVIDGWHRMAYAAECGLDVVPFVRLTVEESRKALVR